MSNTAEEIKLENLVTDFLDRKLHWLKSYFQQILVTRDDNNDTRIRMYFNAPGALFTWDVLGNSVRSVICNDLPLPGHYDFKMFNCGPCVHQDTWVILGDFGVTKTQRQKWKDQGVCPECGNKGEWRMMALFCPTHGKFAG